MDNSDEFKPKHTIRNSNAFQKGREKLGGLILKGMKTTGGTDVDWLVEHRGGFIIIESKEFHDDHISISLGQMIAFEKLHERLIANGKCYFLIFAGDDKINFDNPDSIIWYFEMKDWKEGNISHREMDKPRRYIIERSSMKEMIIKDFRTTIEGFWEEFEREN